MGPSVPEAAAASSAAVEFGAADADATAAIVTMVRAEVSKVRAHWMKYENILLLWGSGTLFVLLQSPASETTWDLTVASAWGHMRRADPWAWFSTCVLCRSLNSHPLLFKTYPHRSQQH